MCNGTSGKEPTESVCEGETKLGKILEDPSVYYIQVDQADLLQLVQPGSKLSD